MWQAEGFRNPPQPLQGDQPAAARPQELLPNQWVLDTKTDTFTEFIANNQDAVLGQLPPGAFLASGRDGRNVVRTWVG